MKKYYKFWVGNDRTEHFGWFTDSDAIRAHVKSCYGDFSFGYQAV